MLVVVDAGLDEDVLLFGAVVVVAEGFVDEEDEVEAERVVVVPEVFAVAFA
jgi:hypothetical protein